MSEFEKLEALAKCAPGNLFRRSAWFQVPSNVPKLIPPAPTKPNFTSLPPVAYPCKQ